MRRSQDLALTFANRAFLTASGNPAREAALQMNIAFDRSGARAREHGQVDNERWRRSASPCWPAIAGRSISRSRRLPSGAIVGSAST
jgi:hypothetical protein